MFYLMHVTQVKELKALASDSDFLLRLIDSTELFEQHNDLEQGLQEMALQISALLNTASCSIMLLYVNNDELELPALHLFAHCGDLPKQAFNEAQQFNQGIAGSVAATAKPLLVTDISHSKFSTVARRSDAQGSFMSVPILISGKVIGVINVNNPLDDRSFAETELDLLNIFAQFVGKSIHLVQLQKLLKSRYLQNTMAIEFSKNHPNSSEAIAPDPVKLEKIVAKSFFRELSNAGFGANAIIGVATEIISLLNQRLERHRRRVP